MSTGKSWEHRKLKRGGLKKMGKLKYRKVTPTKWWTEAQTDGTLKWKMAQKRAWSPKTWWRHTCENERRRAQTLGCEKRPELRKQGLGQWGPRPPRPERPRSRAGHPLGGPQGEPRSGYAQRPPGSCRELTHLMVPRVLLSHILWPAGALRLHFAESPRCCGKETN